MLASIDAGRKRKGVQDIKGFHDEVNVPMRLEKGRREGSGNSICWDIRLRASLVLFALIWYGRPGWVT